MADRIRAFVNQQGAWANMPRKVNRRSPICFSPHLYRARTLAARFFNKIKQCRRIATRYDKLAANYCAFIKLASIRLWLRAYESTPQLRAPARVDLPSPHAFTSNRATRGRGATAGHGSRPSRCPIIPSLEL